MTTDPLFMSSSKVILAILAGGSDESPLDDPAEPLGELKPLCDPEVVLGKEYPFVGPENKRVSRSAWLEPCDSLSAGELRECLKCL